MKLYYNKLIDELKNYIDKYNKFDELKDVLIINIRPKPPNWKSTIMSYDTYKARLKKQNYEKRLKSLRFTQVKIEKKIFEVVKACDKQDVIINEIATNGEQYTETEVNCTINKQEFNEKIIPLMNREQNSIEKEKILQDQQVILNKKAEEITITSQILENALTKIRIEREDTANHLKTLREEIAVIEKRNESLMLMNIENDCVIAKLKKTVTDQQIQMASTTVEQIETFKTKITDIIKIINLKVTKKENRNKIKSTCKDSLDIVKFVITNLIINDEDTMGRKNKINNINSDKNDDEDDETDDKKDEYDDYFDDL
jgi:hypothetical protein